MYANFAIFKGVLVEEEREKDGVWGLPPEKLLRIAPYRSSESALLEHRMNVAFTIDLCAQKGNLSLNLETNKEQATLTLPFLLFAVVCL